MKSFLLTTIGFIAMAITCNAQWTTSGTNAYFSLTGNVGIGNSSSFYRFTVGTPGISTLNTLTTGVSSYFGSSTNVNVGIYAYTGLSNGGSGGFLNLVQDDGAALSTGDRLGGVNFRGGSSATTLGVGGQLSVIATQPWTTSATGAEMRFLTTSNNTIALTQKMVLTNDGNLGIGTTTPKTTLQVTAGGNGPDAGGTIGFAANSGFDVMAQIKGLLMYSPGGQDQGGLGFYTRPVLASATVLTERMRIDPAGNICVNTTDSRGYKFAVNGSAIATSMTVKLNANWPDYVFKPEYQLPSLTEVKAYIDQNQHLPEIPSEQEIAKDGLNLGEMNRTLVKKVEELTLYLIEQQKTVQIQQDQINQLKEQVRSISKTLNKN